MDVVNQLIKFTVDVLEKGDSDLINQKLKLMSGLNTQFSIKGKNDLYDLFGFSNILKGNTECEGESDAAPEPNEEFDEIACIPMETESSQPETNISAHDLPALIKQKGRSWPVKDPLLRKKQYQTLLGLNKDCSDHNGAPPTGDPPSGQASSTGSPQTGATVTGAGDPPTGQASSTGSPQTGATVTGAPPKGDLPTGQPSSTGSPQTGAHVTDKDEKTWVTTSIKFLYQSMLTKPKPSRFLSKAEAYNEDADLKKIINESVLVYLPSHYNLKGQPFIKK